MDVYCVREKRFTPNVPGSETYATTKNGRRQLKVKCASCGITKTGLSKGVPAVARCHREGALRLLIKLRMLPRTL